VEPRWESAAKKPKNNVDTLLPIQVKGGFILGTEGN